MLLECEGCNTMETAETSFNVIGKEKELPEDDGWYLHIDDFNEGEELENAVDKSDIYMLCPTCKPKKAIPTKQETEGNKSEIEKYIDYIKSQ